MLIFFVGSEPALGQEQADASADSTTAPSENESSSQGGMHQAASEAKNEPLQVEGDTSFFKSISFKPKSGIKTNVTSNQYYGDVNNIITMAQGGQITNNVGFSWTDYRQQIKTIEKRSANTLYTTGRTFPFVATAKADWAWSLDKTTNAGGFDNISKRDYKTGGLIFNQPKMTFGALKVTMKGSTGLNDQKAINRDQRNDVKEAYLDGGMQVGTQVADGVHIAGRLFGRKTGGDRSLGENTAPTSSAVDTLGVGVYYNRNLTSGRVSISRGNFERKFLDYRRNSSGLIDTLGAAAAGEETVVDEMEIKDAVTIKVENETRLLGMNFETVLSQTMDESDFAVSLVGMKEKFQQDAKFNLSFTVGRDSLSMEYNFLWKWDDQFQKNATEKRGKQYNKERELQIYWDRTLFEATKLRIKWATSLGQDTAENGYLTTDKDRMRYDLSCRLERNWDQRFKATMVFSFKQNSDLALHGTRSSNNNVKDSYEIAPSYSWPISDWLTFSQNYRVYIQYTDYTYSYMEGSNRDDNYSKRGNLSSVVKLKPTKRLDLTVKHDYNKRFSADKTNEGAVGGSKYFVDQRQKINKIDLAFTFRVANGVTVEGATYNTRDEKTTITTIEKVSERLEGKIWIGTKVSRKWGADNQLELSAMVKKFNAYGPSISEASRDYWESDLWLKWTF
ncbi:MAG: hypothetical protein GY780_02660 [bacterium]|nr:hypothetical protein [bacterium]